MNMHQFGGVRLLGAGELMWLKDFARGWALSIALFIVLVPLGCGKGDVQSTFITGSSVTPGVTGGYCPAGQMTINGMPCFSATDPGLFYRNCYYGGSFITIGGVQVCRMDMPMGRYYYSAAASYNRPRLGPSNPSDINAVNLGVALRRNDRVSITSSGNWSHDQLTFFWGTPSCKSSIDVSDPSQGLYASDSREAFLAGASVSRTVNNDGYLLLGFNAATTIGCVNLQADITITRCQDQAGNTYPCP